MSVYKEVDIKITGQIPYDYRDKDYEIMLAKIRLIAVEYQLTVEAQ